MPSKALILYSPTPDNKGSAVERCAQKNLTNKKKYARVGLFICICEDS